MRGFFLATPDLAFYNWFGNIFFATRLIDFVSGMLLGLLYLKTPQGTRGLSRETLLEILAIGGVLASVFFAPVAHDFSSIQRLAWQGFYLPSFALLIWVGARQRGMVTQFLARRFFVYLGEISFGIYLFQIPIYHFLSLYCFPEQKNDQMHQLILATWLVVTFLLSILSFHFFEIPLRNRLRKMLEWKATSNAKEIKPMLLPSQTAWSIRFMGRKSK